MVITMLEANVGHGQVDILERADREAALTIPPDMVETFLVRDSKDATRYHIITVWDSREALDKMRASVDKPKGVQIFETAGAAPVLTILDVVEWWHK